MQRSFRFNEIKLGNSKRTAYTMNMIDPDYCIDRPDTPGRWLLFEVERLT